MLSSKHAALSVHQSHTLSQLEAGKRIEIYCGPLSKAPLRSLGEKRRRSPRMGTSHVAVLHWPPFYPLSSTASHTRHGPLLAELTALLQHKQISTPFAVGGEAFHSHQLIRNVGFELQSQLQAVAMMAEVMARGTSTLLGAASPAVVVPTKTTPFLGKPLPFLAINSLERGNPWLLIKLEFRIGCII